MVFLRGHSRHPGAGLGRALLTALLFVTPSLVDAKDQRASIYEVSPTGQPPKWAQLDPYQRCLTRSEFLRLLNRIYAPDQAYKSSIKISPDHVDIKRSAHGSPSLVHRLEFAPSADEKATPSVTPYWRPAAALPKSPPRTQPLQGLRIALDPGHIGGRWARMEERWFRIGNEPPVKEGELTLKAAEVLKPKLEKLGAEVTVIRTGLKPVTKKRPEDFEELARESLVAAGFDPPRESYEDLPRWSPDKRLTVQWQSEVFFYRAREIRDRARIINRKIKPDLVLCLHFNAEKWGDPRNPTLIDKNHFHVLLNGTYSLEELSRDDIRFEMLLRIVQGTHREEIPLCAAVARSFTRRTGLEPYVYPGKNARRINDNPYVFARNLLANRTYLCPVIFLEPYVMNNKEVYRRIQNASEDSPTIFEEYADAVAKGLRAYYTSRRMEPEDPVEPAPGE